MKKNRIRRVAVCAVIAALYAAATLALAPVSYGAVQFRISEALVLLPFIYPASAWGLTVGCALANILSPYGALDMVAGALATGLAAYCTSKVKSRWLAPLPPILFNGIIVSAVQAVYAGGNAGWTLFALCAAEIAAGEAVVTYIIGEPLLFAIERSGVISRVTGKYRDI